MKKHVLRHDNGRHLSYRYTFCGKREGTVNDTLRVELRQSRLLYYTVTNMGSITVDDSVCKNCLRCVESVASKL